MPRRYYVNEHPVHTSHNGDEYEVHEDGGSECETAPDAERRVDLGSFETCKSALAAAEGRGFRPANGCARCVPKCHKD